jgi:hypothetical protein
MKKIAVALLLFVIGCGSGSGNQTLPQKNLWLTWKPPVVWTDNTSLIPERDLKFYNLYLLNVNDNAWFSDSLPESATINCVDNTGQLITEFNLNNMKSHKEKGTYFVSMRACSMDGAFSHFTEEVLIWENQ